MTTKKTPLVTTKTAKGRAAIKRVRSGMDSQRLITKIEDAHHLLHTALTCLHLARRQGQGAPEDVGDDALARFAVIRAQQILSDACALPSVQRVSRKLAAMFAALRAEEKAPRKTGTKKTS